jgi:mRNA interferase YafQ
MTDLMLAAERTGQFKRDYKRETAAGRVGLDDKFRAVATLLLNAEPLPAAYQDHPLKGEWKGFRDCHLRPDLVLIYRKTDTAIVFVRLGSHSELFG